MKHVFFVLLVGMAMACQEGPTRKNNTKDYANAMKLDTSIFSTIHATYREEALYHRRFKHSDVDSLIKVHQSNALLNITQIGASVQGRSIYEVEYGKGDKKVMLWSQMHGDEPTATMALFDLFNFLEGKDDGCEPIRDLLVRELNLHFIPMLNPDGAELYTRRNAQSIDLNRDARAAQTIEGALLKKRAQEIKPNYGFNLHDQNIYYNVPNTKNPVTISLLAPAYNYEREINEVRAGAMQIIAGMNRLLQQYIPDAVAKYDDAHTPRGFGDNFQMWNASTVLIESGGLKGDSEKQEIRKLNFIIILNALIEIAEGSYKQYAVQDYEDIPFNASELHDVVIRNLELTRDSVTYKTDIAIRRDEITIGRDYYVRGRVEDIGDLPESFGYDEVDAEGLVFIEGTIANKAIARSNVLDEEAVLNALKSGILAIPVQMVAPNREDALHNWPILLFTQRQFYLTKTIDLGGTANFFIGTKQGDIKYAVVNGYLIDLSKAELPKVKLRVL